MTRILVLGTHDLLDTDHQRFLKGIADRGPCELVVALVDPAGDHAALIDRIKPDRVVYGDGWVSFDEAWGAQSVEVRYVPTVAAA